jgi:hypothetical protein
MGICPGHDLLNLATNDAYLQDERVDYTYPDELIHEAQTESPAAG